MSLCDYINIPHPTAMVITKLNNSYLRIEFDNNIVFSLRLHNASSKITKTLSLKYDTKILNIDALYDLYTFR
jgi:hypothetical protein